MATNGAMAGKRVLVTGAGTGIGRGVALEFAKEGADVVLHYPFEGEDAHTAVDEIRGAGGKATAVMIDFNQPGAASKLAEEAIAFLGGVDVLINNAGVTVELAIEETSGDQFDTMFNINFRTPYFLTQALVPSMVEAGGGAVINVSSVHAYTGMSDHSVYAATKGAITACTRTLSMELIKKGVRVNAIAPGWIRTQKQERILGPTFDWDAAAKGVPVGFVGQPRDVGRLAIFLASDESRYIVGQTIIIDGGQLSTMPLVRGSLKR